MITSSRAKFRNVLDHVPRARPDLPDPEAALIAGHVLIDGRVVTNPRSQVRADASVVIKPPRALRGEDKLRAALDGFAVDVTDRECVDLGASAGGFTSVLLDMAPAGCSRWTRVTASCAATCATTAGS